MPSSNTTSVPTLKEAVACNTLSEYLDTSVSRWLSAHPAKTVRAIDNVMEAGDSIRCVIPDVAGRDGMVLNAVSCFPWVCARNMPGAVAARYVAFTLKATYAGLVAQQPSIRAAFANGAAVLTTAPVVGVRAGMLAAFGLPAPEAMGPICDALHYDAKRSKLWVRAASKDEDGRVIAWRASMDTSSTPDPVIMEVMLAWSHVAPLLACMASAECYAMGNAYSVPFVQRSISDFFTRTMSNAAYAIAGLDKAIVWDAALQAAVQGYPVSRVMAWASDPVMAVCAERRVLTDAASVAGSRAREAAAVARCRTILGSPLSRSPIPDTERLWADLRTGGDYRTVLDDDTQSMATALMVDAAAFPEVTPDDSVSRVGQDNYVEPPPVPELTPEIRPHERSAFHNLMQGAHNGDARAGSFLANMGDDESVKFGKM